MQTTQTRGHDQPRAASAAPRRTSENRCEAERAHGFRPQTTPGGKQKAVRSCTFLRSRPCALPFALALVDESTGSGIAPFEQHGSRPAVACRSSSRTEGRSRTRSLVWSVWPLVLVGGSAARSLWRVVGRLELGQRSSQTRPAGGRHDTRTRTHGRRGNEVRRDEAQRRGGGCGRRPARSHCYGHSVLGAIEWCERAEKFEWRARKARTRDEQREAE